MGVCARLVQSHLPFRTFASAPLRNHPSFTGTVLFPRPLYSQELCAILTGTVRLRDAAAADFGGRPAWRQPHLRRLQEPVRPGDGEERRHPAAVPDRGEQGEPRLSHRYLRGRRGGAAAQPQP